MKLSNLLVVTTLSTAFLVGCGGGGGDAPISTVSSATYSPQAVSAQDLRTASSFTVTAADATGTYQVTVSDTPLSDAVFEGITRNVSLTTVTTKQGNALLSTSSHLNYYGLNPSRRYGSLDTDGAYTVTTATGTMPVSAKVGETWSGDISAVYSNSSKTKVLHYETRNWSLEADTLTTAFLCANNVRSDSNLTGSSCRKIDAAGNILGHRVTLFLNGQSLTFK